MPWIPRDQIHRCDLPKYDPEDPHFLGHIWQCPEITCNRQWEVCAIYTSADVVKTGTYRFNLVVNPI